MLIHFGFRAGKIYYPQVFLEECKNVVKEKQMPKYITEDVEISTDEESSDEENCDKENSDEENYSKETIFREQFILKRLDDSDKE